MNKKNQSKQKLLDAAFDLFAQNGFHGTSLRDISAQSGVNVALVSRYFSSKQGLYQACFASIYEQIQSHQDILHALFSQGAYSTLIQEAFHFAKQHTTPLLLIQRALLFDQMGGESAHSILMQFAQNIHSAFPERTKEDITLALQSVLILLTRYALMSTKQKEHLIKTDPEEAIVLHLTSLTQHFFSRDPHDKNRT